MLKEFCSIATRYEKTDASHSAVRHLVGSAIASEECPHALVDFYNDGEEVKGAGFQDVQRRRSEPRRGCLRAPSRPSPLEAGWLRTRARTRSRLTSMSISAMRPHGGPGSALIPCRSRSNFGGEHHIRFAQPRALGRKVSDEYAVPVCRLHHRDLHGYASVGTRPQTTH